MSDNLNAVKIIALDFDGTLVTNEYPKVGTPIQKNIRKIKEEIANGAKVILWTNRVDGYLKDAVDFCDAQGIHLDAVNENLPEIIAVFGRNPRKIFANEYWDDHAVLMSEYDVEEFLGRYWISVDERLPEKPDYDWVLVKCQMVPEGYFGVPHIAELRNGIWYSDCYDGPLEETAGVKVTHWMPLPDDPVERQRNGKASKVFLGGTCNGSTWREKLIPMIVTNYFNPVVEDWTPQCQKEEYRQKHICDLHLYVITPKMTGTFSIAELIDSSNKNPKGTIFMILTEDDGLKFDDSQLRSLHAVADMAKKNGAEGVFDSFEELAFILNSK
jgi:hypothetical protein